MTKIITSPEEYTGRKNENIFIFLAGPIQGAPEWQQEMCKDLLNMKNIVVTSPRRKSLQKKFEYEDQVEWETKYLNMSDILVFWIPKESEIVENRVYGQTTRFELAEWVGKNTGKKIIVGIDKDFPMKKYIKTRLEKDYDIKILNTYDEVVREIKSQVKSIQNESPKIYFTSDTHFGSERTLELSKRPFRSVKEMDSEIILKWNSTVNIHDTVYHLGDFGDYSILDKLNGNIYLILGNYEIDEMNKSKLTLKSFKDNLIKKGFKNVFDNLTISIKGDKILKINEFDSKDNLFLTHEPLNANKSQFNLYGHIHARQLVKRYGLDVGTDGHHFRPISLSDVIFYKNAIENHYDNNVFE